MVVVWAGGALATIGAMRQVFLDTETTGLDAAGGDRIIEVACIEMVDRRHSGRRLHHYVNPQRPSHPDAVRVHGITDDFLADKPLFAAVAEELLAFVAEYFREPDSFLGLLALGMSMGQWLCLPMIAAGALMWWWFGRAAASLR